MKLAIICCVGLTPEHLGSDTPHLTALASSGNIFRKLCAPVIVSIVSTRFWTPARRSCPPAAEVCR